MDLLQEAQSDSWEKVKNKIAEKGIPINAKWLDYAILNRSLECGRNDVARLILEKGCRVNKSEYTPHNTPLHKAVMLEDGEIVEQLLQKGASVTALNYNNNSPLHLAFKYRQDNIVDQMLNHISQSANYANPKNREGLTHLHIASTSKNKNIVKEFLDDGAEISDAVDADYPLWPGYTAMHFAVAFGSLDAAKVLQKAKGGILKDSNDKTPLQMSFEKVYECSVVAHVLSSENNKFKTLNTNNEECELLDPGCHTFPSYFHLACMRKNPRIVEKFIKSGAEVNTPISRSAVFCSMYTPLHFAVESNCPRNVKILLKHGADVKIKNNDGMTPLHLALYNEDVSKKNGIVDVLYKALEKKDYCEDKNGMTFLHVACTRNDVSFVKQCLDNFYSGNVRVQRNLRKFSLYTPLHFAARYRAYEVAKLLVERAEGIKADVNAHDDGESGTTLHIACQTGHAVMIDLLLKNGAKANVLRVKDRKTPIHLLVESYMDEGVAREQAESFDLDGFMDVEAEKYELLPFIAQLAELGAHVNARDSDNRTALHRACSVFWNGAECAKKLLEAGADVNLEAEGRTALQDVLSSCKDNYDDVAELYHHVQKLKALGFKVNQKNEQFCSDFLIRKKDWSKLYDELRDDALAMKELERLEEIRKMKMMVIDNRSKLSLFNFVACDAKNLQKYARNDVVREIVESKDVMDDYPLFAFLIKLQYQRAVKSFEGGGKGAKKRAANGETSDVQTKQTRSG